MLALLLVVIESNWDEVTCQRYTKTRALVASVSHPALTALEKGRRGYRHLRLGKKIWLAGEYVLQRMAFSSLLQMRYLIRMLVYRPASLLIRRFGLDGLQSFRGSREFASGDGREWDDRFRRLKRCFDGSIDFVCICSFIIAVNSGMRLIC
jgi:hypothetical protein